MLFSTKERDFSTGLDYFGFRYYDAVLGKFTTRDPSGYPDGPNNYLYCNNNPINAIDPLGLEALETSVRNEILDKVQGLANQVEAMTPPMNIKSPAAKGRWFHKQFHRFFHR